MKELQEQDPLLRAIADLDEETSLKLVGERLQQGWDSLELLKICQEGIRVVGRRYEEGQYFISGLIMGGGILKRTVQLVKPGLEVFYSEHHLGVIVLGTVEDDIHDIGKSIVNTLLCCQGFKVVDLGVDVPPEAFVQAIIEHKPRVLGLSCLLTTAFDSLKRTIQAVESAGLRGRMPILVGGGQLDRSICEYVGADHWTSDAVEGVDWCVRSANAS